MPTKHTRYFNQPSGSIQSALAVHLINPTFYVGGVNNQEADDPTNPTISLLHDAGLSSSDCILFDSLNVRARTEDMKKFYTDDLWKSHRDYVQKLRTNMWAAVEICMGQDAFADLSKSAILKPFPLWEKFEKVRLWVEVDKDQTSVKRFVVHAYHPAFFPRSKRGPIFDEKFSKPQDLAILMARQLAKLPQAETPHYFESAFVRGGFAHLSPQAETQKKECERLAMDAFEKAFPDKCIKIQVAQQFKELKIKTEMALIDKMKALEPLIPMQVPSVEVLSLEDQVNSQLQALNLQRGLNNDRNFDEGEDTQQYAPPWSLSGSRPSRQTAMTTRVATSKISLTISKTGYDLKMASKFVENR